MLEPEIIYEDVDMLAVNKPAGLLVHAVNANDGPTLVDWLLNKYPNLAGVGEPFLAQQHESPRAGIAHRLDRETSGIVLVAKNNKSFNYLKDLFQTHQIKKTYLALVHGVMKDDKGVIDAPIGRSKQDPRRRLAGPQAKGLLRPAVTEYQTLERFPGYSYVALFPKTGRTHQLRVHLQSIGRPVVGDGLYAAGFNDQALISRQALHASALELPLPNGTRLKLEASLPADLAAALEHLRGLC